MATGEFGRGKTIFVLAVVIGCFAILWPKIFYPMLTASLNPSAVQEGESICCDVIFEKDTNAHKILNEICTNILRQETLASSAGTGAGSDSGQGQKPERIKSVSKIQVPTAILCRNEILKTCGVDVFVLIKETPSAITKEYKESLNHLRAFNTSQCMKFNYGVDFREIGLPRKVRSLDNSPSHMRPERPMHFRPDMMHPALREKGRAIPVAKMPVRTIEKEARPGPMPGVRPPVGGAGHVAAPPKGGGTMGIIMPIYTIGIVVFFIYTIMKILFRKSEDKAPQIKDFGMDPEHRKYVLAEEYTDTSDRSLKEPFNKEDRELGIRRRTPQGKSRFGDERRRLELEPDPEQSVESIDNDTHATTETFAENTAPALPSPIFESECLKKAMEEPYALNLDSRSPGDINTTSFPLSKELSIPEGMTREPFEPNTISIKPAESFEAVETMIENIIQKAKDDALHFPASLKHLQSPEQITTKTNVVMCEYHTEGTSHEPAKMTKTPETEPETDFETFEELVETDFPLDTPLVCGMQAFLYPEGIILSSVDYPDDETQKELDEIATPIEEAIEDVSLTNFPSIAAFETLRRISIDATEAKNLPLEIPDVNDEFIVNLDLPADPKFLLGLEKGVSGQLVENIKTFASNVNDSIDKVEDDVVPTEIIETFEEQTEICNQKRNELETPELTEIKEHLTETYRAEYFEKSAETSPVRTEVCEYISQSSVPDMEATEMPLLETKICLDSLKDLSENISENIVENVKASIETIEKSDSVRDETSDKLYHSHITENFAPEMNDNFNADNIQSVVTTGSSSVQIAEDRVVTDSRQNAEDCKEDSLIVTDLQKSNTTTSDIVGKDICIFDVAETVGGNNYENVLTKTDPPTINELGSSSSICVTKDSSISDESIQNILDTVESSTNLNSQVTLMSLPQIYNKSVETTAIVSEKPDFSVTETDNLLVFPELEAISSVEQVESLISESSFEKLGSKTHPEEAIVSIGQVGNLTSETPFEKLQSKAHPCYSRISVANLEIESSLGDMSAVPIAANFENSVSSKPATTADKSCISTVEIPVTCYVLSPPFVEEPSASDVDISVPDVALVPSIVKPEIPVSSSIEASPVSATQEAAEESLKPTETKEIVKKHVKFMDDVVELSDSSVSLKIPEKSDTAQEVIQVTLDVTSTTPEITSPENKISSIDIETATLTGTTTDELNVPISICPTESIQKSTEVALSTTEKPITDDVILPEPLQKLVEMVTIPSSTPTHVPEILTEPVFLSETVSSAVEIAGEPVESVVADLHVETAKSFTKLVSSDASSTLDLSGTPVSGADILKESYSICTGETAILPAAETKKSCTQVEATVGPEISIRSILNILETPIDISTTQTETTDPVITLSDSPTPIVQETVQKTTVEISENQIDEITVKPDSSVEKVEINTSVGALLEQSKQYYSTTASSEKQAAEETVEMTTAQILDKQGKVAVSFVPTTEMSEKSICLPIEQNVPLGPTNEPSEVLSSIQETVQKTTAQIPEKQVDEVVIPSVPTVEMSEKSIEIPVTQIQSSDPTFTPSEIHYSLEETVEKTTVQIPEKQVEEVTISTEISKPTLDILDQCNDVSNVQTEPSDPTIVPSPPEILSSEETVDKTTAQILEKQIGEVALPSVSTSKISEKSIDIPVEQIEPSGLTVVPSEIPSSVEETVKKTTAQIPEKQVDKVPTAEMSEKSIEIPVAQIKSSDPTFTPTEILSSVEETVEKTTVHIPEKQVVDITVSPDASLPTVEVSTDPSTAQSEILMEIKETVERTTVKSSEKQVDEISRKPETTLSVKMSGDVSNAEIETVDPSTKLSEILFTIEEAVKEAIVSDTSTKVVEDITVEPEIPIHSIESVEKANDISTAARETADVSTSEIEIPTPIVEIIQKTTVEALDEPVQMVALTSDKPETSVLESTIKCIELCASTVDMTESPIEIKALDAGISIKAVEPSASAIDSTEKDREAIESSGSGPIEITGRDYAVFSVDKSVVQQTQAQDANKSVVTAVKGIIEAMDNSCSSKPQTESESESKPESQAQQHTEDDIEKISEPQQSSLPKDVIPVEPGDKLQEVKAPGSVKPQEEVILKPAVKKEVKIELPRKDVTSEEEDDEEEASSSFARPPTPPRTVSIKPKQTSESNGNVLMKFAQELSGSIVNQSAAAAIAAAKAQANAQQSHSRSHGHNSGVSVVGFEESFSLESGKRWNERSPTPTFRQITSPVPHRAPTPPEYIPSIYLEGCMPASANKFVVSNPQIELEGGGDADYDDDYDSVSAPVVLSGKVTLSVISGVGSLDEITEPPSVSLDDYAKADSRRTPTAAEPRFSGSNQEICAALASTINDENGAAKTGVTRSGVQNTSKASSPDMDEYEVIGKGFNDADKDDDGDVTHYSTASAAEADTGGNAAEETANDISAMDSIDDGRQEDILDDEEGSEEEEEDEE